ncbi:acyl carrier protein [Litorilituus sediminis]|uniref:Acyl carrier protein n=1 Tax=Litorilituus sediminis TaxID=718192 RepID=A0A4P6PBI2_9GAMM|nr:acyl carrier protein [Litorilituus sediminis]QBG36997.1 acyl carrier protein [Litorilituus sediminis]
MDINSLSKAQLTLLIKQLIVEECDKEDDFEPEDILDEEPLFGRKSRIALDSLDALQLSLVLKKQFAISIEGSKESRKHLQSVDTIAQLILAKQA